jgi:hypothetical protein
MAQASRVTVWGVGSAVAGEAPGGIVEPLDGIVVLAVGTGTDVPSGFVGMPSP